MQRRTLGVLAIMVMIASYTQADGLIKSHRYMPVGRTSHAYIFYFGGSMSGFEAHARRSEETEGLAVSDCYTYTGELVSGSSYAPVASGQPTYSKNLWLSDYTLTGDDFQYGGEGHVGVFFATASKWRLGLEALIQSKAKINYAAPIVIGNATSSDVPLETPFATEAGTSTDNNPVANTFTGSFSLVPKDIAYGIRMMPAYMITDALALYAAFGYGFQRWNMTTSTEFFEIGNQYLNGNVATEDFVSGTTASKNTSIFKTLGSYSYGVGGMVHLDDGISIYSGVEIQQYADYNPSAGVFAKTHVPSKVTFIGSSNDSAVDEQFYWAQQTSLTDVGTGDHQSFVAIRTITYSLGINVSLQQGVF